MTNEYKALIADIVWKVGSLEWSVLGYLYTPYNDLLPKHLKIENISMCTLGQIAQKLKIDFEELDFLSLEVKEWLKKSGTEIDKITERRNDVLHARPATDNDGVQRLYRWGKGKGFFIREDFIKDLLNDIDIAQKFINKNRPLELK